MRIIKIEKPSHLRKRGEPKELFWIEGVEEYQHQNERNEWCRSTRCGPYDTWTEANNEKKGMQAIYDDPGYTGMQRGL